MYVSLKLLAGALAVAGAAALLLPSSAQQPDRRPTGGDGQQPDRSGLDKVKQDLLRAAEDLAKTKQEIERLTKEYETKAVALKAAMEQIKMAEEKLAVGRGAASGNKYVFGMMGGSNSGSVEKRLADIEKKLDTVMQSVEELHKQLAKRNPPVANPPGGPRGPGGPPPGGPGLAPVPAPGPGQPGGPPPGVAPVLPPGPGPGPTGGPPPGLAPVLPPGPGQPGTLTPPAAPALPVAK